MKDNSQIKRPFPAPILFLLFLEKIPVIEMYPVQLALYTPDIYFFPFSSGSVIMPNLSKPARLISAMVLITIPYGTSSSARR